MKRKVGIVGKYRKGVKKVLWVFDDWDKGIPMWGGWRGAKQIAKHTFNAKDSKLGTWHVNLATRYELRRIFHAEKNVGDRKRVVNSHDKQPSASGCKSKRNNTEENEE